MKEIKSYGVLESVLFDGGIFGCNEPRSRNALGCVDFVTNNTSLNTSPHTKLNILIKNLKKGQSPQIYFLKVNTVYGSIK